MACNESVSRGQGLQRAVRNKLTARCEEKRVAEKDGPVLWCLSGAKTLPQNITQEFISVFNQLDAQNLFHNKFISCLYMFRAHVLIIGRSKLHYTASSIIKPIGGQLDAQNLFHNKFYFMPLHVSSTCAHHQEVKIAFRARDGHL